ncbi:hypothetical protein [Planosporangium mesophilum]|uniref:hypothetical protein n=1 Tax=Planosporangium mesophilum TaxID=689768 RepID=UPI00194F9046|nr:hypothetical protein [Planosporangium mesophilum]
MVVDVEGRRQQAVEFLKVRLQVGVVGCDLRGSRFQIQPFALTLVYGGRALGRSGCLFGSPAHRLLLAVVGRLRLLGGPHLSCVLPLDLRD